MRALLKSNDPVLLSYAADLLAQEGIETVVFETPQDRPAGEGKAQVKAEMVRQ